MNVSASRVLPVSLLVSSARLIIERHLGLAWIAGEISNLSRSGSGHCYFHLRDEQAQVRCVFFRHKAQFLDFALRDGMQVEVRAVPTIYEARGEFQLNVETVRLAGAGALYEKFARMKDRLEGLGWFRAERKRPVPTFPRAVGIVTSPRAAALHDVLTTLRRRMPCVPIIIYPTAVQGDVAAGELAAAIAVANRRREVDVLIVCRGGGSIEDLWAFNEEALARAVMLSDIPVVSGVGHETDFTICDFVADARAPTPTAAANLVVPDRRALVGIVAALAQRAARATERALELRMQRMDFASQRLVHPAARLQAQSDALARLALRLVRATRNAHRDWQRGPAALARELGRLLCQPLPQRLAVDRARERWLSSADRRVAALDARLAALQRGLHHLGPQAVLERGYSIVTTLEGKTVQDAAQLAIGHRVRMQFARGQARAEIEQRDTSD